MVLLQRKLYFSNDPKGSYIFQGGGGGVGGGGQTFSRGGEGVLIIISKETHIT